MPRKKPKTTNEPLYVHNVTAGWNPKSGRWTSKNGRITSQTKALAENSGTEGGWVRNATPASNPVSTLLDAFESVVAGSQNVSLQIQTDMPVSGVGNALKAALKPPLIKDNRPASWMDHRMRALMLLSEHYFMTEGDASHICSVPVELVADDIIVECGDAGLRNEIRSLLHQTQMSEVLAEAWLCQRVYGQAYPYEVWDGTTLEGIVLLPPLHVHIGDDFGMQLSSEMMGLSGWTEALIKSRFPQQMYQQMAEHWNEQDVSFSPVGVDIPRDVMTPIKDLRAFSWMKYAMPMLSLGFRDLTDRTIHEDSIRAVIEGYKYQLWIFTVGDMEHPPMPGELNKLSAVLSSSTADRTGKLVWRGGLNVEIKVPEGLDSLIGRNYLGDRTRQFFRKMGVTSRVLSGETPGVLGADSGGGTSGDTAAIDVSLYMERVRFQEKKLMAWLSRLVEKWIRASSSRAGIREMKDIQFHFPLTDMEREARIKNVLGPMYREGALSWETYLKAANFNRENEEGYKKAEKKLRDAGLLDPPASFAQKVVGQGGETVKTVSQTAPQGSPNEAGEQMNDSTKPVKVE